MCPAKHSSLIGSLPHMTSVPDVSSLSILDSPVHRLMCAERFQQNAQSVHDGTWGAAAPGGGPVRAFLAGLLVLSIAARLDRLALRAAAFSATADIIVISFKVSKS